MHHRRLFLMTLIKSSENSNKYWGLRRLILMEKILYHNHRMALLSKEGSRWLLKTSKYRTRKMRPVRLSRRTIISISSRDYSRIMGSVWKRMTTNTQTWLKCTTKQQRLANRLSSKMIKLKNSSLVIFSTSLRVFRTKMHSSTHLSKLHHHHHLNQLISQTNQINKSNKISQMYNNKNK